MLQSDAANITSNDNARLAMASNEPQTNARREGMIKTQAILEYKFSRNRPTGATYWKHLLRTRTAGGTNETLKSAPWVFQKK